MLKKYLVTILSMTIIFTMISASFTSAQSTINLNNYDGKTIYRGLVFGQGPVSELLSDIWTEEQKKINKSEENVKRAEKILNEMENVDPNFFNEFEQAIKSGNHKTTYSAIVKGSEVLQQAIKNLDFDVLNPNGEFNGNCMAAVAVGIVFVAGIYVLNAAIAANGLVVANVAAAYNETVSSNSVSGDMELELLVDKIVDSVQ